MKKILITLLVLLLAIFFIACPQEPVAIPTFSPVAGEVNSGQEITITTTTEGATIYYTSDNTNPTRESTLYSDTTKPKIIANNTTIKAIAVKEGMIDSEIASATYTITPPPNRILTINIVGDGSVSVSVDGTILSGSSPYNIINGSNVILTATGNAPQSFAFWSDDITGITNPATITNITYNMTVTATFADLSSSSLLTIRVPDNIWEDGSGYEVLIDNDGDLITDNDSYPFDIWNSANIQSLYTYNDILPLVTQYPPSETGNFIEKTFIIPSGIYDFTVLNPIYPTGWNGTSFTNPPTTGNGTSNPTFSTGGNGKGGLINNYELEVGEQYILYIGGNFLDGETVLLNPDSPAVGIYYDIHRLEKNSPTPQSINTIAAGVPFSFTIRNVGPQPLTIDSVVFTNTSTLTMTPVVPATIDPINSIELEFTATDNITDSGVITINSNEPNTQCTFKFTAHLPEPITLPESFEGPSWSRLTSGNGWILSSVRPVLAAGYSYTGKKSVAFLAQRDTGDVISMYALFDVTAGQSLIFRYRRDSSSGGDFKIYEESTQIGSLNTITNGWKLWISQPFSTSGIKKIKFEGIQSGTTALLVFIDDIDLVTAAPDINIKCNSREIDIVNGSTVDFGKIRPQDNKLTFTIENLGTKNLVLEGGPRVEVTGDAFVNSQPDSPINIESSETFQITIENTIGNKTINVSIDNNDPDEDPYTFTFTIEVINPLFYENFNSVTTPNLPTNWISELITGTTHWDTYTPYGEDTCARYIYSEIGEKARLITPAINLSSTTADATLNFYIKQNGVTNYEQVRVFLKIGSGNWTPLAEYLNPISEWTPKYVLLPNTAGENEVYIAFEGTNFNGQSAFIDDVAILP